MTRTDLHRLVDELPETSLDAAAVWLGRVRDPGVAKLQTAPLDDEPFTEDGRKAAYAAMLASTAGNLSPWTPSILLRGRLWLQTPTPPQPAICTADVRDCGVL